MKKLFLVLATTLVAALTAFAFAGCDRGETPNGGKAADVVLNVESVVFTVKSDYIPLSGTTSVKDYMDAMQANGELVFGGENSDYGFYLTSVYGRSGKTVVSTANSYAGYNWAFYTTVTELDGVIYSTDYATFNYDGVTLYKASYGVSGVPCIEGETYALVYEYSETSW